MSYPKKLTRRDLEQFLPNQRAVRAFELLFDLFPDDMEALSLSAGAADNKAETALALIAELSKQQSEGDLGPLPQQHNQIQTDYIEFNRFARHAEQPTQMGWNEEDGTVEIGMGYDGVIQQIGLESFYRIKASAAISKGDVVMFTGAVGASGVVKGAPATGITEGQLIMGVATMDIPNNGFGYVTTLGLVRGFRTDGSSVGETWSDGDILYYNPAYAGGMTNVQPVAPLPHIIVAAVINATHGNSGSVLVRTTFLPKVSQLTDVTITSPSVGDALTWDGTKWTNQASSGVTIDDVTALVIALG
jgi:hypothetical protein